MRVVVDLELCEGNAVCSNVAPEVFVVGDDDRAHLLIEQPPESLREQVLTAIRRCPRQALALEDDGK
jgi:ferredoxin